MKIPKGKPRIRRYKLGKYASVKLSKKGAVEVKMFGYEVLSSSRPIPVWKLPKTLKRIYKAQRENRI